MSEKIRTGGCQCGAVRFRIRGELGRPSICHCRMCQKQFGSFFSAFVSVSAENVEWPHEEPTYYNSSVNVERGFCQRCGTPLIYRSPKDFEISIGSFDERDDLAPQLQVNHASRLPWVDKVFEAPVYEDEVFYTRQEGIISFQHPDHEVENWPSQGLQL